ncbi:Scr1 family TA system antitoxin-like transcriptional regulator [Streptomyces seoulensis]|uniref:Scr1 family TA system antitoxin-like transcriptional regulator n=1 Tax=Streptomyces seoulensis TaxID=73044 RepID=UPI001FCAD807|nr:Scr1 family TA system antitoxin-like transcriptional regulator [Streptomyces seoulensis]
MAGSDAVARYAAVARTATESVHYTNARIPPAFRTPLYRGVVTASAPTPDEPEGRRWVIPPWLAHVPIPPGQRLTLILDDTVLRRSIGGPKVMAEQLRHLMHLMDHPRATSPVTIRIAQRGYRTPANSEVAEYTVHGHRMIAGCRFLPRYEARSEDARSVQERLRDTVQRAQDHDVSYRLIKQAAERWEAAS